MYEEGLPADATCLISLAKIDAFDLACMCITPLVVSPGAWRESVLDGERLGYAAAARIRAAAEAGTVRRVDLDEETEQLAAELAGSWRIGQGESETLAVGRGIGRAIVDDGRAARVAGAIGVEPVSTLFLPVFGVIGGMHRADAVAVLHRLAVVANVRTEGTLEIEGFIGRLT
jgi:predicted nucleic acid-binding protein